MAARLPSWAWVSGLTVGATAAVIALAIQAEHGPHPTAAVVKPRPSATASAAATPTTAAPEPSGPPALPEASGQGRRIVYALGEKRVWLVDATGKAVRTFTVWPGTVGPQPGRYSVLGRTPAGTGSDGVGIEHILYFTHTPAGDAAFSNAIDGSSPPPANGKQTTGIRLHKEDGVALWAFGDPGTRVAVVK
ncbi:hypothetical protein [Streptomyces sp. SID4985]|uniref:hypothetical protein n=1 Tax=unclassified Streptomyces TaxID=2593676 RepID=UPI00136DF594|nr:hypothetical protein [Streptomyces sp. SID4985]